VQLNNKHGYHNLQQQQQWRQQHNACGHVCRTAQEAQVQLQLTNEQCYHHPQEQWQKGQ
jgi:hypothetical protein